MEISERTLRRSEGRLVIGRDEMQSHVTIADHTVSRRHAVLWLDERGLLIEDANSRNWTWIDGRQLWPSAEAVMARQHVVDAKWSMASVALVKGAHGTPK